MVTCLWLSINPALLEAPPSAARSPCARRTPSSPSVFLAFLCPRAGPPTHLQRCTRVPWMALDFFSKTSGDWPPTTWARAARVSRRSGVRGAAPLDRVLYLAGIVRLS
ncbi:hypothetical protein C8R45DRAFT_384721 [Mycena sanguinolenta]|nr:hypothetical protein C8R45DRAFT_384721 [Mycena sanguinolenta]